MSKRKLVTRELQLTTAEVLSVNKVTNELSTYNATVAGHFDGSELMDVMRNLYEDVDEHFVRITKVSHTKALYGMNEQEFYAYSRPMKTRSTFITDPVKGVTM